MNIVWAALIVLVTAGSAIVVMLVVRRGAPDGSYYNDGDRAAGVFGVIATGFSVLLGFLIFLAFASYDASRAGAEDEAVAVAEQIQTAQLMPADVRTELTGHLVCYARWVVSVEWEQMEAGTLGEEINPWGAEMFLTIEGVEPGSSSEEAAFGKWLDQTTDRQEARQARIHGAAGVMPAPLWVALFFIAVIAVVFVLGFADSGERKTVQALYMGSVVSVIVSMLLLINFLDGPFHDGIGGLQPGAMQRTLVVIDEELNVIDPDTPIPCGESGRPTR